MLGNRSEESACISRNFPTALQRLPSIPQKNQQKQPQKPPIRSTLQNVARQYFKKYKTRRVLIINNINNNNINNT